MAIRLQDKENVQAPGSPDFPYGAIKDDTGSNDGTPVNQAVYQDIHQFFARLGAQASITYNGVRDGINGVFQYFEALVTVITNTAKGLVINNVTSTTTDQPLSANQGRVLKNLVDTVNSSVITLATIVSDLENDITGLTNDKVSKIVDLGTFDLGNTTGIASLSAGFYTGVSLNTIGIRAQTQESAGGTGTFPVRGIGSAIFNANGKAFSLIVGPKSSENSQVCILSFELDSVGAGLQAPAIFIRQNNSSTDWFALNTDAIT